METRKHEEGERMHSKFLVKKMVPSDVELLKRAARQKGEINNATSKGQNRRKYMQIKLFKRRGLDN